MQGGEVWANVSYTAAKVAEDDEWGTELVAK